MPTKLNRRAWIFPGQCIWQPYAGISIDSFIHPQEGFNFLYLAIQRFKKFISQGYNSVLAAFAEVHLNLPRHLSKAKIDIFHSMANKFDTPQPRAVKQSGHKVVVSAERREQCTRLVMCQNDWQFRLPLRPAEAGDVAYRLFQKFGFQEYDRIQRQCLGTRRDVSLRCEKGKKTLDLSITKLGRMPFVTEQNEKLDPVQVGINGPPAVTVYPHITFDGLEKRGSCDV